MNLQPDNPFKVTKAIIAASMIALVAVLLLMATSCSTMKRSNSETNESAFAKASITASEENKENQWDFGEINQESLTTGYEPVDTSKPMVFVNSKGDTTQIHNGKKTETRTKTKEHKNRGQSKLGYKENQGEFENAESNQTSTSNKERTGIPALVSIAGVLGLFIFMAFAFMIWKFNKTLQTLKPPTL